MALPYTFGSGTQLDKLFLTQLQLDLDQLQAAKAALPQAAFITGVIEAPTGKDINLIEKVPLGITLTSFSGKTSAGTLTATLKVGATPVTNGVLSASSVQSTVSPTALNVLVSGNTLVMTISAVAAAADFSYVVAYTYNLSAA